MTSAMDVSAGIVWRTCPIRASLSAGARAWLTRNDLIKGEGISHPQARTRFLVARALLRRTIAEARPDLGWAVLDIRTARSGRPTVVDVDPLLDPFLAPNLDPELEEHLGLYLAVSHTRGLAAVAVSTVRPVGIDVEPLERDDLPPARIWLTPQEQGEHSRLPPPRRREQLLRLWVAKEAALKACDATHARLRRELEVRGSGEVERVPTPEDDIERSAIGQVVWREVDARFLVAVAAAGVGR